MALIGDIHENDHLLRDDSRHSITYKQLPMRFPDEAPPYAMGAGYVLTRPLAELVAKYNAKDGMLPTVHLEDVSLGLWIEAISAKTNAWVKFIDANGFKVLSGCSAATSIVINPVGTESEQGICIWDHQNRAEQVVVRRARRTQEGERTQEVARQEVEQKGGQENGRPKAEQKTRRQRAVVITDKKDATKREGGNSRGSGEAAAAAAATAKSATSVEAPAAAATAAAEQPSPPPAAAAAAAAAAPAAAPAAVSRPTAVPAKSSKMTKKTVVAPDIDADADADAAPDERQFAGRRRLLTAKNDGLLSCCTMVRPGPAIGAKSLAGSDTIPTFALSSFEDV